MEATKRSSSQFWPATYQERGTAVPFTTPSVAYSRVRKDTRDGLEVLVPGLSGGRGVYVIPWAGLRNMFKLTVHDRALHEEIATAKAASPAEVRQVALQVAQSGLAGLDVGDAARNALEIEAQERMVANYNLIGHVIKVVSGDKLDISLDRAGTPEAQREIRQKLAAAAGTIGIEPYDLNVGLEYWADMLAPVGAPGSAEGGRLRRLMRAINQSIMNIGAWSRSTPTDVSDQADMICRVATGTGKMARSYAATIDRFGDHPGETLKNWPRAQKGIEGLVGKLIWLLDGWENIVATWDHAVEGDTEAKVRAIEQIYVHLPVVPREELDPKQRETWTVIVDQMAKLSRAQRENAQGDIDLDTMLRLEETKVRSM